MVTRRRGKVDVTSEVVVRSNYSVAEPGGNKAGGKMLARYSAGRAEPRLIGLYKSIRN
jgi:hypothetical protein